MKEIKEELKYFIVIIVLKEFVGKILDEVFVDEI